LGLLFENSDSLYSFGATRADQRLTHQS